MSYLDRLREAENLLERASTGSVESVETTPNGTLDTLDTTPPSPSDDFFFEKARRLWLIRHEDGRLVSHSFTPPATETEVLGWYPEAIHIEHEDNDEPDLCD